tara:strand:+ start:513 stop:653 length:141 start_codon:yes stop_codon:yes gene_type:complete
MFWKKKQEISKRTKKILIEDLRTLKNQVLVIGKEIENMTKYIEGLK